MSRCMYFTDRFLFPSRRVGWRKSSCFFCFFFCADDTRGRIAGRGGRNRERRRLLIYYPPTTFCFLFFFYLNHQRPRYISLFWWVGLVAPLEITSREIKACHALHFRIFFARGSFPFGVSCRFCGNDVVGMDWSFIRFDLGYQLNVFFPKGGGVEVDIL